MNKPPVASVLQIRGFVQSNSGLKRIKLFVFHYAWCEGMKDVFKLSSHRIVTLSGSLLVWAGSIACFRSKEDVNHFMTFVAPSYFFGDVGWYPLLAVLVMAFRKREKRRIC